jgi:uncharacterized delta-60 repeat protein
MGDGASDATAFDPSRASIDVGYSAVVQRDGKIVVAGISRRGSQYDYALARYRTNGKLDSSFARGGVLLASVARGASGADVITEQPDGKLVVAGAAWVSERQSAFSVSRYTPRGALDATFGRGGTVLTAFRKPRPGKFAETWMSGLALQRDGRIVAAARTIDFNVTRVALARYTRVGTLDATFGKGGKVEIDSGPLRGVGVRALVLQRDGKIVVAGYGRSRGRVLDFAVARLTSRGAIDRSFGNDGRVTTPLGYQSDAGAVAIQADGKIVAAGSVEVAHAGTQLGLARYLLSGVPDPSFGTDGTVLTDFALQSFPEIVIQPDSRIVVACGLDGPRRFGLGRYDVDGTLDPTFGEGGKVRTRFPAGSEARTVALQRDGKIVAAGSAGGDFAVARYAAGGTLDRSFGGDGRVTTPLGPAWLRRGGR